MNQNASDNLAFVFTVLIHGIMSLGFAVIGVYALTQGYVKSGGWLIAGGIISMVAVKIKTGVKDESDKENQNDTGN
jgi:predicted phage tail protein